MEGEDVEARREALEVYETHRVPGCGEVISTNIIQSYFQFQSEESGQKCRVAIKFGDGRYIDVAMDGKLAADETVEAYKLRPPSTLRYRVCGRCPDRSGRSVARRPRRVRRSRDPGDP